MGLIGSKKVPLDSTEFLWIFFLDLSDLQSFIRLSWVLPSAIAFYRIFTACTYFNYFFWVLPNLEVLSNVFFIVDRPRPIVSLDGVAIEHLQLFSWLWNTGYI